MGYKPKLIGMEKEMKILDKQIKLRWKKGLSAKDLIRKYKKVMNEYCVEI